MTESWLLHGVPIHVRHGRPPVEALAMSGGRVVAAGPLAEVRDRLRVPHQECRLDVGAVVPAFVDAHQHAALVAADPATDTLHRRADDIPGLLAIIAGLTTSAPPVPAGRWRRFHGYEPLALAQRRSPTAAELDAVVADRPLHVISRTFHESVVNSAGLDELGIGRGTADPPGGRIVRDRRGRPTGVLLEAASFIAEVRSRPDLDRDAWRTRLAAHGRRLLAVGITRIGDAAVPAELAEALVRELAAVGIDAHPLLTGTRIDEPTIRPGTTAKVLADGGEYCHLCLSGAQLRTVMAASLRAAVGPDRALAAAVGRRSGFPRRADDGRWHSGIRYPQEVGLGHLLQSAADAGAGLAVHAVGNGAVAAVLDALALDRGIGNAVPVRVEHAMAVDDGLARRLGAASVPVVAQPGFLTAFGHQLTVVPVPPPLRLMPFRTLLDAGVPLAFSSDFPAAGLDPWSGVAAAVDRLDGRGQAVHPEEAITLTEALDAFTRTAASALGLADAGCLEPGMRADVVWCDQDPYAVPIARLGATTTLATWCEGSRRYLAPEATRLLAEEHRA